MTTRALPAGAIPGTASGRRAPSGRLGTNAVLALVGDVASKLGAFLALALAAHILSVRDFATLSVCLAVLTVLTAALDGGVAVLITRDGASAPGSRGPLLVASLRERLGVTVVLVGAAAAVGALAPGGGAWLWTVVAGVVGAATLTLLGVLRASQDLASEAAVRTLGALVAISSVAVAVVIVPTATGVLAALALAGAASLVPLAWRVRSVLAGSATVRATRVLRAALPLGAMAIATIAYYRAPTILLGMLGSDAETGRFNVAATVAFGLLAIPNAITTGLLPRLASASTGAERLIEARRALRWTLVATVGVGIVVTATAPWLMVGIFGSRYAAAGPLALLMLAGVVIGVNGVIGTVLVADGKLRPLARQVATSLAVNVALAVALVPSHGARGAAVATLVAECVALALLAPHARRSLPGLLRPPGLGLQALAFVALLEGVAAARSEGLLRLALGSLGVGAIMLADPRLSGATRARATWAATRLGVLRGSVLVLLAGLGSLAAWATATGYGLRVTSDTPSFLTIVRQLADRPFESLSPFLASGDVQHSHVTPYTQALGLLWNLIGERGSDGNVAPDSAGLYRFLAVAGVVVSALFFHALFLWVRRLAGSAAAWRAIPVVLLLFGPAEVIWAGDLSFHGFLYGPYLPQTLAMALLLYTLVLLGGPATRSRVAAGAVVAGTTLAVHPFTGALLCVLIASCGVLSAVQRRPRWFAAPGALAVGFGLAMLWPAYSIDRALAETGLRGRWLVALCLALPVAARLLCEPLGRLLAFLRRAAGHLDRPRLATGLALAGLGGVLVIGVVQVMQFLEPRTDPVIRSNRLALYWVEDRWRWPFMLLAGAVGVVGLARIAARGRLVPVVWLGGCLAIGVGGAAGLSVPVWWRFLLFAQVPLALGTAVWLAESRRGWTRRIVVGALGASLVFRVVTLLALPPTITYLNTPVQPAYNLGNLIPDSPGLVASDPFTSYFIPASSTHRVLTVTKAHVGSRAELRESQDGYALLHEFAVGDAWWEAAQEMYSRGVRFVVVEKHTLLRAPTLQEFSTGPTPVVRTAADRRILGTYFYRNGRVGRLVHDDESYAIYRLRPRVLGFR